MKCVFCFLLISLLTRAQLDTRNSGLIESIGDGERFILSFFDLITVSASHIYESAIDLAPKLSTVRQSFQHLSPQTRSWNAVDDSWDACIRKIDIEYGECVVFSHTGDRVAVCGGCLDETNFLVIVEAATGMVLSTLKGHEHRVTSVAFSLDDSLLVSGSEDRTVRFWDIQTGGLMRTLEMEGGVSSVAFSSDRSMVASNFGIWDVASAEPVHRFEETTSALVWSPIRADIVLGCKGGKIRIVDVVNWTRRELPSAHESGIRSLAYSRDGTKIASSSFSLFHCTGGVEVHHAERGGVLQAFDMEGVNSVCFSREGEKLVLAHWRSMVIRDLANSVNIATFEQPVFTHSVSVSPDGTTIALADGNKLSIWPMNDWDHSSEATGYHSRHVNSIVISPDSSFLASGSSDHTLKLWNFATGACLHTFDDHPTSVNYVAISPDSLLVASGNDDNTIRIWRVADRALVCTLHGHDSPVTGVAFCPTGQRIASISQYGELRLWEIEGRKTVGILGDIGLELNLLQIRVSGDGTGVTLFKGEKSRSWELVELSVSSPGDTDSAKLPIIFVPQDQAFEDSSRALYKYTDEEEWILDQYDSRIFWLPPHLRGRVFDCRDSTVAMGTEDGRVFWFDIGTQPTSDLPVHTLHR
jgi:WD40 repeat protein